MKKIAILLILISCKAGAQQISFRKSNTSTAVSLSVPLHTATNGSLMVTIAKEPDRNLTYFNYVEKLINWKGMSVYGGAGIQMGSRQTLSWKRDANSIFLAGVCAIGGIQYSFNNMFIGADIMPRVDIPVFGGCEEHRYCSESRVGSVNFSIGLNLK